MNNIIRFTGGVLVLAGTILLPTTTNAMPILSFSSGGGGLTQMHNVGDLITLDVWISGLDGSDTTGGADLGGFDFDVNFDGSVAGYLNSTFNSALSADFFGLAATPGGLNSVNFSGVSLSFDLSGQADAFPLFSLDFSADQVGTSFLNFSNILLSDSFAAPLLVDDFTATLIIEADPITANVSEPGMLGLLMLGLMGPVLTRRRTSKGTSAA